MVIVMDIDFNKIEKIYGKSVIESLSILRDDVIKNIEYFMSLGFDDVIDIFERQVVIFICSNEEFISKVNALIKKIGINYIDEIENDISLLDELL